MSYEGIRITDELDRAVQRTVRITQRSGERAWPGDLITKKSAPCRRK
jgi:hypothetical protein